MTILPIPLNCNYMYNRFKKAVLTETVNILARTLQCSEIAS